MFIIEEKRTRAAAERSVRRFIQAQSVIDVVWARMGMPQTTTADEAYSVVQQGPRNWAVVCVDPSVRG